MSDTINTVSAIITHMSYAGILGAAVGWFTFERREAIKPFRSCEHDATIVEDTFFDEEPEPEPEPSIIVNFDLLEAPTLTLEPLELPTVGQVDPLDITSLDDEPSIVVDYAQLFSNTHTQNAIVLDDQTDDGTEATTVVVDDVHKVYREPKQLEMFA